MVLKRTHVNNTLQQDKTQAAENNSSPPVTLSRLKAGALEISYTMGVQDWIASYRIGIAHFRLFSFIGGTFIMAFATVAVGIVVVACWVALDWQRQGVFPWHSLRFVAIGPVVFLVAMPLILWAISARQVALNNKSAATRVKGGTTSRLWQDVTCVLKEQNYVAICSGTLDALVIPYHAFPGCGEAEAFYEQALNYWHAAKGTKPPAAPETAGVWPPAPRVGNSAEPSDGPEC